MISMRILDDDTHFFTATERRQIEAILTSTEADVRSRIPLPSTVPVTVSASDDVLPTGDNAFTDPAGVIHWWADPHRGPLAAANAHLAAAFAHEAFHLARFTQLPQEGSNNDLLNAAVNEGLATAFARDLTGIHEPWGDYNPVEASAWLTELEAVHSTVPESQLTDWKFHHPDGREWIAFRVGTWLVDQCQTVAGQAAAGLVHTPAGQVLGSATNRHP